MSHSHTQGQGNPTRDEPGPFTNMVTVLQIHNRIIKTQAGTGSIRTQHSPEAGTVVGAVEGESLPDRLTVSTPGTDFIFTF